MKAKTFILTLAMCATASAEVWYVPGWNRTTETNGLAYTSCTNVFKGKVCAFWGWDGDRSWSTSAANADVAAKRLAAEIASTNAAFRSELVIVGHSLGGRIVARPHSGAAEDAAEHDAIGAASRCAARAQRHRTPGAASSGVSSPSQAERCGQRGQNLQPRICAHSSGVGTNPSIEGSRRPLAENDGMEESSARV